MTILHQHVSIPTEAMLGSILERNDIRSSLAPFHVLPGYTITYPGVVTSALCDLFAEYNKAFTRLTAANREWSEDYQYCPVNFAVQIDMLGLPPTFLDLTATTPMEQVREMLRKGIFEVENSIATYTMQEQLFSFSGRDSFYKARWRAVLGDLHARLQKPIALLAPTEQKYTSMREVEFGKKDDEQLSSAEVFDLSGFDGLFGPNEFTAYLEANKGKCGCALYVRASDPVDKLKHPNYVVNHPLLGSSGLRQIIKANALTLNIDDPNWDIRDPRKINDTKRYLPIMRMAHAVTCESDLSSPEFRDYLRTQGVDPEAKVVKLRCKPAVATYGCYGHLRGDLRNRKFREKLRYNLRQRGVYVVQPELNVPQITNSFDGRSYVYVDRVFLGIVGERPVFLGGIRIMMPQGSIEAQQGRIHGNRLAVFGQIVC